MPPLRRQNLVTTSLSALAILAATQVGWAQDGSGSRVPPGWHVRHVRTVSSQPLRGAASTVSERSLTVRRPMAGPNDGSGEPIESGGTVYNDIRTFAPEPTSDSGVQFPYGLDGIGGFGSAFGFAGDADTITYDRGAFAARSGVTGIR